MLNMRFVVTHTTSGCERLGTLSGFTKSPGTVLETPTSALFTRGGSIVHLTADVIKRTFSTPQLLWVPLSNSIHLETGAKGQNEGVAKFAGLGEHFACVSVGDTNTETPNGHFERDMIPLWTRHGKQMINANRYMDIMDIFKPEIVLALADCSTSLTDGHKRIGKSVERTCNLLEVCTKRYRSSTQLQNSALVGVVVGGDNREERQRCISRVLTHKDVLKGVALSGLTRGGAHTHKIKKDLVDPIIRDTADSLPPDLFRILEGCWNPVVTLTAVAHGFDVFDGSYPAKLTNLGKALVFHFNHSTENSSEELCILDLNDGRYKEDFQPLLSDCECLACSQHTRAYIHHLLITKEMLAPVLLNIHNLHHYSRMFQHVRQHILKQTFEDFRSHISKQYELYMAAQNDSDAEKSDVEVQQVKKKRLSPTQNMNVG